MNKTGIFLLLWVILFMTACSSNQPEVEAAPTETISSQMPTQERVQPTATRAPTATVKPTLEITDTPEKTDVPTESPGGETEDATGHEAAETLVLQYNPNETNYFSMETSPDGYRLAYQKFSEQGMYVVLEEEEYGPYDEVSMLFFSSDNQHLAYVATLGSEQFVVLDGVEKTHYKEILTCGCSWGQEIEFSPDGNRLAYIATKGQKPIAVIDGEEFEYDGIEFPILFSPDSKRVVYVARNLNGEAYIIMDGIEGPKYDYIDTANDNFLFSPDSNRFAYSAAKGNDWFVVTDAGQSQPMEGMAFDVIFSPDSQHIAYDFEINGQKVMVLDGEELESYEWGIVPVFSPDSQRLVYRVKKDGTWYVSVDGELGPKLGGFQYSMTFSPDSQRLAYKVEFNDKDVMVVDEEIQEPHDVRSYPIFSPDSQHLAYSTYDGEIWHLVLDGEEIEDYEGVSKITFSPDSNHILFIAQDDDTWIEYVVLDGVESKKYDKIISPILFDSENSFHYMAILDDEVYLVEEIIN